MITNAGWLKKLDMKTKLIKVLQDAEIFALTESARVAQIQADLLKEQLAVSMLKWLREKLPAGTVIDLRHNPGSLLPDHLHNVRVSSGNSRGTKLFRIERIRFVEPDPRHPDLSAWYADATPISMVNGKDMSGAAGNSKHSGREFLGLKGSFGLERHCED